MSETKFTPGPWGVRRTSVNLYDITCASGVVADVTRWHAGFPGGDEECAANAALIAAAPTLYEALEYLEHAARAADVGYLDGAVERARAALARARGEA